ncbi:MAG: ZIP family metal transporter [Candidatus Aenigmatarchaeota archaeon]
MIFYILLSTFIVSLIGLVGIFSFFISNNILRKVIKFIVPFASGVLISVAFFHLLSESLEKVETENALKFLMIGFILFLLLEFLIHWHHCHEYKCNIHSLGYLTIFADVIHNFLDGVAIAIAYLTNFYLGIITTFSIIFHEIPQEISNFSLLLSSGFKREKAVLLTFLSQLSAILGGILGFYFLNETSINFLLPLVAGGFLYLAAVDILPEIKKEKDIRNRTLLILFFIFGIVLMYILKVGYER